MESAREMEKDLSRCQASVAELEARIVPLRHRLERAEEQVRTRSEALAEAQEELAKAQNIYRSECRKLASGETSNAVECKRAAQELEAKVEGLKQLVDEDQQAVVAAQAALVEPQAQLMSARQQEAWASGKLRIASAMERVGKNLGSLSLEVDAAIAVMDELRGSPEIVSHSIDMQRARLHGLRQHLLQTAPHFAQ